MEFDLISAYSFRISWSTEFQAKSLECFRDGFHQTSKLEENAISAVVVNLEPSLTYTVSITTTDGERLTSLLTTCDVENPCLENLYMGLRNSEGVYDTTRLNKNVHDIFLANFSSIVTSGDSILANVTVNGIEKEIMTSAIIDGGFIGVSSESNVFLPFSKDNGKSMQAVTLKDEKNSESATLAYDREEDAFFYGGEMYRVGDRFEMFGQMVTVGDGSIVLIFSDTVVKDWLVDLPFQHAYAASVALGTAGTSIMSNCVSNTYHTMTSKTTGASASTYHSAWVHDTDLTTTQEITRMVHTIDDNSENATLSLGVLHTDLSLNQFIEPTIQSSYDYTSISSQDALDATRSAVFRSTGLQFDNDDSCIYFGSAQQFRIKFTDGTPDILSVQYYDTGAGDYISKAEFSSGSS